MSHEIHLHWFGEFSWPMKMCLSNFMENPWSKSTPMKSQNAIFMAIKITFMGFSPNFHGIFMKEGVHSACSFGSVEDVSMINWKV